MRLTQDQKQGYADKGFVRVAAVLAPAEVDAIAGEWQRLWDQTDRGHPSVQWRGHESLGTIPDRIDPAYLLSPMLRALCDDPRLLGLAADAISAPALFFKDKLITKLPGTHGYGLHQDWPYWSDYGMPAGAVTTLIVALDPADGANGALEMWPGQRTLLPPAPDDPRDVDPSAVDPSGGEIVPLDPGDVLLLHALTPHRSAPNRSATPRRAYFVTYVAAEHAAAAHRRDADKQQALSASVG